jgi:hypothetical protein
MNLWFGWISRSRQNADLEAKQKFFNKKFKTFFIQLRLLACLLSSGNEVIETIVEAIPKNNDSTILIKVDAVSINSLDWKVKKGDVKILSGSKFPKHIAVECSGTIQAVGAKDTSFSTGDEVFGCVSDVFKNGFPSSIPSSDPSSIPTVVVPSPNPTVYMYISENLLQMIVQ